MPYKLANNARGELRDDLGVGDTLATLIDAAGFPSLEPEEWCPLVIGEGMDNIEICRITSRNGTELILERGQEGTIPQAWPWGTPVEIRLTAGTILESD